MWLRFFQGLYDTYGQVLWFSQVLMPLESLYQQKLEKQRCCKLQTWIQSFHIHGVWIIEFLSSVEHNLEAVWNYPSKWYVATIFSLLNSITFLRKGSKKRSKEADFWMQWKRRKHCSFLSWTSIPTVHIVKRSCNILAKCSSLVNNRF